jgi:hypothetical protein
VSSTVQSPISMQLRQHEALTRRLAAGWRQIVILERLARAGGAARWFFVTSRTMLDDVFNVLRGGSSVSFYFSGHLHVEIDNEAARQEMFDEITRCGEIVLGYPAPDQAQLEMAIISGPSELTECLILHSEGSLVVWGEWPARENDGESAITADLVDADGVLRPHPH